MAKNQCPLGEDCDLELVCSCSLTTAWMAGAEKAQDQIKAQAAEIERLRFDLKRAVQFTKGVIRHAGNSGDDYLAEQARATLAELTGAQKNGN